MQEDKEVAIFMANCAPLGTLQLYWLFSRTQIEFILSEIETIPPSGNSAIARARYLNEALPIIDLEEHYDIVGSGQTPSDKYIVTRTSTPEGELVKLILRSAHPVRMRKLSFTTTPAPSSILRKNEEDILGAFFMDNDTLLVVPDLTVILKTMST